MERDSLKLQPPLCLECCRSPRPDENPDDDWRAESDGLGELHVFCPECWEREFDHREQT